MANTHRRKNFIVKIKVNGEWIIGDRELREGVVGGFKSLFFEEEGWRPSIEGLSFETLEEEEVTSLEGIFLEEEVLGALLELNGVKAPGLDGFSMVFWHFSWEFVKFDVLNFFNEFHEHGRFVRNLNTTFLVLIPKKKGAVNLKDFRSISLVGSLYKWMTKVLVNRLKKVMEG
ncbi:hypothetical protein CK203_060611 [Vitis vinifera]|uniref:Reverse transcriptase domain-containing protein n=1 Tax=Vitis vinifera TaxID=29760 RepID=A0A438GBW8_VITVI|nr:hypothetical protein CK203_060611 [Vitis vinifera]